MDTAFAALATYDQGSSRGDLVPIDQAVKASLGDELAQKALEQRLVGALQRGGSAAAVEFICSKLAVIGSKASVPVLATLLAKPEFATAARTALEAIPGTAATKALREALPKVEDLQKIGVIHSLGARRDEESVRSLTKLVESEDSGVAAASMAALGDIATSQAAKALLRFKPKTPEGLRLKLADAMLTCAERLSAAGKKADAKALYESLAKPNQPKHLQKAVSLGLQRISAAK